MTVLVIVEHDHQNVKNSTLSTLKAALEIDLSVDLLVAGSGCGAVADQSAKLSVGKILVADSDVHKHFLAENISAQILVVAGDYSHILLPATTFGKDIAPRVAAKLDVAQISDISAVVSANSFKRPIYAGNAIATVESADNIKVITVRSSAFDSVTYDVNGAEIVEVESVADSGLSSFVSKEETVSDRPELTSAKIVVSGGRGMGSKENFSLIDAVADKLGAAIGASRAAVDAGYVPNDYQVGQTGKIIAPDLYIAVGLSGAIQHLAGMKDSKVIVAINKDENAPIFEVADYGLVADLFDVLPEMEKLL